MGVMEEREGGKGGREKKGGKEEEKKKRKRLTQPSSYSCSSLITSPLLNSSSSSILGLKSSCTLCTFVGGLDGLELVAAGGIFGSIDLSDLPLTLSGAGIWLATMLLICASVSTSFASA